MSHVLWECPAYMLDLVKSIDVWELRKVRLYGDNPSVQQSQSHRLRLGNCRVSLVEGVSCVLEVRQTLVLLCSSYVCSSTVCSSRVCLYTVCSLSSGSAHSSGCMVNGSSAMAAS